MGVIGNNAVLFPPEANKATQFIRLCNTRNTPIVFLQNSASSFRVWFAREEELMRAQLRGSWLERSMRRSAPLFMGGEGSEG